MGTMTHDLIENRLRETPDELDPGAWRRCLVIALALPLAVAIAIALWGMIQGSWAMAAYSVEVPEGVPEEVATVRRDLAGLNVASGAIGWLDEALCPRVSGSDMLYYLRAALEEVKSVDDPRLDSVESRLRVIIGRFETPKEAEVIPPESQPALPWLESPPSNP